MGTIFSTTTLVVDWSGYLTFRRFPLSGFARCSFFHRGSLLSRTMLSTLAFLRIDFFSLFSSLPFFIFYYAADYALSSFFVFIK
jgi:hypothetical protein